MNRVDQISTQNLQDSLTILYKNFAQTLLYVHGKEGQIALREAITLYGRKIGKEEREQHQKAGLKPNLKTLFETPMVGGVDPRYRIQWQLFNEQEAVFDVITCPIWDYLRLASCESLYLPYCEERLLGTILEYTFEQGQCNLGEMISRRGENSNRYGCYYRPANLKKELREQCFTVGGEQEAPHPAPAMQKEPERVYTHLAELMMQAFLEVTERRHPGSSLRIIAGGLKGAAKETAAFLDYRNDAVGYPFDDAFVEANCIWGSAALEGSGLLDEQKKLVSINYVKPLFGALKPLWAAAK